MPSFEKYYTVLGARSLTFSYLDLQIRCKYLSDATLPSKLGMVRKIARHIGKDKDVKNLTAAGSLGIRVVNLSLTKSLAQSIEIMLGEPLPRAVRFLQHNAKHLHPFTEDGTMLRENYLQLLILEATQDK